MKILILLAGILALASPAYSAEMTVTIHLVSPDGVGKAIGTIRAKDTTHGLLLIPDLSGLPPGIHGFHVHETPDCGPAKNKEGNMAGGHAAGGHYDPDGSKRHTGPYGDGHRGDLPILYVDTDGKSNIPVLAPRLKTDDLKGRALMVHNGGDNYSDQPKELGGGGGRIACGLVK
jgi:Cu-Zn family superoxide dismutase